MTFVSQMGAPVSASRTASEKADGASLVQFLHEMVFDVAAAKATAKSKDLVMD